MVRYKTYAPHHHRRVRVKQRRDWHAIFPMSCRPPSSLLPCFRSRLTDIPPRWLDEAQCQRCYGPRPWALARRRGLRRPLLSYVVGLFCGAAKDIITGMGARVLHRCGPARTRPATAPTQQPARMGQGIPGQRVRDAPGAAVGNGGPRTVSLGATLGRIVTAQPRASNNDYPTIVWASSYVCTEGASVGWGGIPVHAAAVVGFHTA